MPQSCLNSLIVDVVWRAGGAGRVFSVVTTHVHVHMRDVGVAVVFECRIGVHVVWTSGDELDKAVVISDASLCALPLEESLKELRGWGIQCAWCAAKGMAGFVSSDSSTGLRERSDLTHGCATAQTRTSRAMQLAEACLLYLRAYEGGDPPSGRRRPIPGRSRR